MKLIIHTNYAIKGTCRRHTLELRVTYYRINNNRNELYIYVKNKGYYTFDTSKIYDISTRANGYCNHITFNEGNFCDILPEETTQKELLLELLKHAK